MDANSSAFALAGAVAGLMRNARIGHGEIAAFIREASAGDSAYLFRTCAAWVTVS
jgi:hypothetical protein